MQIHRQTIRRRLTAFMAATVCLALMFSADSIEKLLACPFCSAINLTFTEQLSSNDVVVIAKLLEVPPPNDDPDAELPKAQFEVVDIVKGKKWVTSGMKFRTLLVGRYPVGQQFMVMGVDPPSVSWSTPMKASERLIGYLKKLETLPKGGAERLEFFQKYFEDKESVLAFDAYDEFARAPYEDLIALKDRMRHDQLVEWIKDPETSINRRRLYFTMLGVCGKAQDIELLEELIKSGDRKKQAGLDALIACYLNLKGADGVKLVEETFIKDKTVDYVDTLSAVSALRFHGTEVEVIPKEKIVSAIRHLLDRPKMADMIIPDLARWEDWSVMEQLVQMFKDADEETNWLRVPVITYLRACPKPEAKKYIEELSKIDPDAVRRADFFLDFGDDEFGDDEEEETDSADDIADTDKSEEPAESGSDGKSKSEVNDGQKQTFTSIAIPAAGSTESHRVQKVPLENPTNQSTTDAVATKGEATFTQAETVARGSMAAVEPAAPAQIAQSVITPAPVATATGQRGLTLTMIFVPMFVSLAIFLLLWSVINGWFERLIV